MEMPDAIAARPTFGIEALPVPYVAVWSDERKPRATRIIRWRGHPAIFTHSPTGVPDFGSTNSHRQRLCMEHGQCQICGEKGARLYVVIDDSKMNNGQTHIHLWESGRWIINAPLHRECFEYSRTVCPHLRHVEPYAMIEVEHRLPVVGYSDGVHAWPLDARPQGMYAAREAIVGVPDDA